MNEPSNQQEQQQRATSLAVPAEPDVETPADAEGGEKQNAAREKRERFTEKLAGFSPVFEFAVAVAAVVGLLLVILQIYYLGRSDRLSREALRLTRENNASSDKTSQQILDKMEASNKLTRDAIEQSKRQSEANRAQGKADADASRNQSAKDAAASLQIAKRSLEESQRAWLAVSAIEHKLPKHGETFQFGIINTGHSPARNVAIIAGASTGGMEDSSLPDVAVPYNQGNPAAGSVTTIGAGVTQYLPVDFVNLTDDQIAAVKQGTLRVYLFGNVVYNDIYSNRARHLRFCNYFQPSTTSWAACRTGNESD